MQSMTCYFKDSCKLYTLTFAFALRWHNVGVVQVILQVSMIVVIRLAISTWAFVSEMLMEAIGSELMRPVDHRAKKMPQPNTSKERTP